MFTVERVIRTANRLTHDTTSFFSKEDAYNLFMIKDAKANKRVSGRQRPNRCEG